LFGGQEHVSESRAIGAEEHKDVSTAFRKKDMAKFDRRFSLDETDIIFVTADSGREGIKLFGGDLRKKKTCLVSRSDSGETTSCCSVHLLEEREEKVMSFTSGGRRAYILRWSWERRYWKDRKLLEENIRKTRQFWKRTSQP
jgi:hypothetical protein